MLMIFLCIQSHGKLVGFKQGGDVVIIIKLALLIIDYK